MTEPLRSHPAPGPRAGGAATNVLMVGVGGQGVVLASDILAVAALRSGHDVKKSEIHGMSQRGGPVFSHVRFGPVVHSPTIPAGEADILYSLERMEVLRWAPYARPGAAVAYFGHDILPIGVSAYPDGIDEEIARLFGAVVRIEDAELKGVISPKVKNCLLLGAISPLLPMREADLLSAMDSLVPPGTYDLNRTGFELGRDLARSRLAVTA